MKNAIAFRLFGNKIVLSVTVGNPEFPESPIGSETGEVIPVEQIGKRVIELLREEKFLN